MRGTFFIRLRTYFRDGPNREVVAYKRILGLFMSINVNVLNFKVNVDFGLIMWRKGSENSDRFEYLQNLVTEFQDTESEGG